MMPYNAPRSLPTNRRWMRGKVVSVVVALLQALPLVFLQTGLAHAEDRRFHIGLGVPVDFLQASFQKTVDNTSANTLVPEPRRGMVFQDQDSANATASGIGFLAGYRLPLSENGLFLTSEVDFAFHRGSVDGQFDGLGTSPGRNQLGESWPDHWTFEKDKSYGFTLKLGGNFGGGLRSLDASFYGLGGIRFTESSLTSRFNGCLSPTPCSSAPDTPDFTSGSDTRGLDLSGWTVGLGVEKMLGKQLALQIETRFTQYGSEDWITPFDDVGVNVPAVVDTDSVQLLVRLAWYY